MALFKQDPFPGTDYSQYLNWDKVTLPSGEVLYVIPGHPGYTYDPVASNATGRHVFRANPQQSITDDATQRQRQQEQQDRQDQLIKQQQQNQSPLGQLLPIGAGTAGIIAASRLGAPTAPAVAGVLQNGMVVMADGSIKGAGAALGGTTSTANAAAQGALGTTPALQAIAPVSGIGPIADGGAYATSLGGAPAVAGAPEAAGLASGYGIGLGPLAAVAAGTFLGGKSAYDELRGKNDNSIPGLIGRGTLGIATGGLSELARPFLMRKTTKQIEQQHTSDLLKQAPDDQAYQTYVAGMRQNSLTDPSKPFAGKYASWDEYKTAGLDASDLSGVYGNIKTYGPAWAGLTQAQRQAVTQANIDSGIYNSKKGEVEITDPVKAKENFNNVMKGFQVGVQTGSSPTVVTTPAQAAAQGFNQAATNDTRVIAPILTPQTDLLRTVSRSPGIGLNGQRISY